MRSTKSPGAAAASRAGADWAVGVRAVAGAEPSQAERAARALEQGREPREVRLDRAFLEAALDPDRAIDTLVAAFVPRFADWCFVDLVDQAGVPRRVRVVPADPAQDSLASEMLSLGFGPGWATPAAQAVRDRAPRLYREVTPELMAWATHGERHLAVFRAMGPTSLVAVPLLARGRVVGAVTIVRCARVPAFDEWALVVAGDIAAPAALAIDNARAYAAARAAAQAMGAGAPPEPSRRDPRTKTRAKTKAAAKARRRA